MSILGFVFGILTLITWKLLGWVQGIISGILFLVILNFCSDFQGSENTKY